jgi:hypothetical protein
MQLIIIDIYLVGSKERLPGNVDLPIYKRQAFPEGAGVCEY